MTRLLVARGTVLPFDAAFSVLEDHDVLVEGNRITAIAPAGTLEGPFDRVLWAGRRVVMPGLVNAHTHLYSAFARGLWAPPSADFQGVLRDLWWRLDRALDLEAVGLSAWATLLEAIRAGCTTLVDHHASPCAVRGSLDALAEAVCASGLRACLCYEVSDRDGAATAREGLEENAAFLRRCAAERHPQLRGLVGLHASFTLEDATLRAAAELGKASGAGFHVHLAEDASDARLTRARHGCSPTARLAEAGVLGPESLAAHGVHLDAEDRARLARAGATVVHNPQSNQNNGVGLADLPALAAAGIPVALGTDAMTADPLAELRAALWAQHLRAGSPSAAFPEVCATLTRTNPALASRLWGAPLGTLAPGALADLLVLDYDPVTPMETANALGHLVFGLAQAGVRSTVCGGRVLMEDGELCLDLDEAELRARCRAAARRVWARL